MNVRFALLVVVLAGCLRDPDQGVVRRPRPPGGPRVDSYSESSSVTRILPAPPYAWIGTNHGLDRFDLRSGDVTHYGLAEGLPGERVVDLVAGEAGLLWVLTEAGLSRHDPKLASFTPVAAPPSFQGRFRVLASDPVGGVWLGGSSGLFRAEDDGEMWGGGYARPISALLTMRSGELWMGVEGGLAVRRKNGAFEELGPARGVQLASVEWLLEWPDGGVMAVGKDAQGRARIALSDGENFVTFRPSPEPRIVGVARRPRDVVLLTPQRLYALVVPQKGADVLRRAGMHLVSQARGKRSPYEVRLLDAPTPRGASAIASLDGEILLGTVGVGTERVAQKSGMPSAWLRRRDLVKDAVDLSVACVSESECYIATGTARAWRWDGVAFAPFGLEPGEGGGEPVILAFVRAPDGGVVALYHDPQTQVLRVARLEKGAFVPLRELLVETPGGLAGLTFAKFSPEGFLWVGLQTRDDEDGEPRAYGVASMDLSLGAVMVHREEIGDVGTTRGMLPVPRNVTDVAFVSREELWFATINGAARVHGKDLTVFTENEGLESEILHGIVATDGGLIFVASSRGVGEYDGARWRFPRALRVSAHALARGGDGRLWMGTDHGLLAYDGRRISRVDRKRGLLDDEVYDVAVDHYGRLWVRGAQGVSVVDP